MILAVLHRIAAEEVQTSSQVFGNLVLRRQAKILNKVGTINIREFDQICPNRPTIRVFIVGVPDIFAGNKTIPLIFHLDCTLIHSIENQSKKLKII